MTLSKIAVAVLALASSFGPALAESGENQRNTSFTQTTDVMAAPARAAAGDTMFRALITPAQQVTIDRNVNHNH